MELAKLNKPVAYSCGVDNWLNSYVSGA